MLRIKGVTKSFGRFVAVDDVCLNLNPGIVGLVGHNGAGKTTLMNILATITKPDQGTIVLGDEDVIKKPSLIRQCLGYLPQDFGVFPNMTAREILEYFAALKRIKNLSRIDEVLELVNLHSEAHRIAHGYSGGMMRRLGIAQALLNDPKILIVDEPTAGLDPEERLRFKNLLSVIGKERLIIFSTHIVSDIENMAHEIAVMGKGRLLSHTKPSDLIRQANGKVWEFELEQDQFEMVSKTFTVLHSQFSENSIKIRVARESSPYSHAKSVVPSLEDALMISHLEVV